MTGSAGDVVQARDIKGGIHFHGGTESASLVPAQLPGNVFGFVNRMEDIEILDRLLCGSEGAPGQVAVCVLNAAPGIGKTALAIRWAHRVREQFPDGQLYVNLRGYDWETPLDPQRVLAGFLIALGVAPGGVPSDRRSAAPYTARCSQRGRCLLSSTTRRRSPRSGRFSPGRADAGS